MQRFWLIGSPRSDDYRHAHVNGEGRWTHELPYTGCRTCARPRSSDRVLPLDCPEAWRGRAEVTPRRGRSHFMTNAEFEALREEITPALAGLPDSLGPVQRGDAFQPTVMRIPSWPEAEFLWLDSRLGTFLVSDRVRTLWEGMNVTGAVFSRVEFERVGRRKASAPLRPRGGEPGDAHRRIPAGGELDAVPVYHMVTVTGTTGLPAEIGPADVCAECGRGAGDAEGLRVAVDHDPRDVERR